MFYKWGDAPRAKGVSMQPIDVFFIEFLFQTFSFGESCDELSF